MLWSSPVTKNEDKEEGVDIMDFITAIVAQLREDINKLAISIWDVKLIKSVKL